MLTLEGLRARLSLGGQIKSALLRFLAVVAALFVAVAAYDNRSSIIGLFRAATTGVIYVDSPEIYTRERLVNDRFVQDSWLRSQLDRLNDWKVAPSTIAGSMDGLSIGKAAKDAPPPPKLAQAATAIGPAAEFRIENAARELIRQEIIENQLDDRHDFGGNTIFMLKFDTAILPGDRTTSSAVINIRVGPETPYPELQEQIKPGELPRYITTYYEKTPFHTEMLSAFSEWTQGLTENINDRMKALNLRFWDPADTSLDGEFGSFLSEAHNHLDKAALAEIGAWPMVAAEALKTDPAIAVDPVVNRYVAMFILQKAVEEVNARAMNGVTFTSSPGTNEIRLSADWPVFTHMTPGSGRSFPPSARVVARELNMGAGSPECISQFEAIAAKEAGLKQLHSFPTVANALGQFQLRGKSYAFFTMDAEDASGASTDLSAFPIGKITSFNIDRRMTANSSPRLLASTYVGALLKAFVEEKGPQSNETLQAVYGEFETAFPNNGCTLDVVPVPTSYFRFLDHLMRQHPFSYAVLPKYDADVESVEASNTRQLEVSSLLNKISGDLIPANLGAELLHESAVQQSRARTRLIGYGSSSGSETPSFGWVISPGASPTEAGSSGLLEPQQKSLAALISVPAWWREIKVNVRTGWTDRDSSTVSWSKCNASLSEDTDPALPVAGGKTEPEENACEYLVRLPLDPTLIDDIVLRPELRKPHITQQDDGPRDVKVQRCTKASIEIPGLRLWRSTVVTLAGQRANSIVVLPDMRGIIAEFDPVQVREGPARLTVWTSEGSAAYPVPITVEHEPASMRPDCSK